MPPERSGGGLGVGPNGPKPGNLLLAGVAWGASSSLHTQGAHNAHTITPVAISFVAKCIYWIHLRGFD